MARVTVEDCLDKTYNRFSLVLLVSKRAKQLLKGATPTEAFRSGNKYIVNSLREVAAGRVKFKVDEDIDTARKQIEKDLNK